MSWLYWFLYWALGVLLTVYAGQGTYFTDVRALIMLRPFHALLAAFVWVLAAHKYTQYLNNPGQ